MATGRQPEGRMYRNGLMACKKRSKTKCVTGWDTCRNLRRALGASQSLNHWEMRFRS